MKIEYDACPLCAKSAIQFLRAASCIEHPLYKPELPPLLRWMRCCDCSHVFTDGYWTPRALEVLFADTHAGQKVGSDFEAQRYVSARIVEKVLPYRRTGRWLDVGFGNASLLMTAHEFGFAVTGLDLRRQSVEALERFGIQGHACAITDFDPPEKFDVISMMDVLEHMPFPAEGLKAAHRLLADSAVLLLSMPNHDSDAWELLDAAQANPYWMEIEHFHNFGRRRLYDFLAAHGFEPLRYGVSERYRVCMEVVARKLTPGSHGA